MPAISLLTALTATWAVATIIFAVLMAYKSVVRFNEEDTLILSAGESNLQEEQKNVRNRVAHIQPYIRGFGWVSIALLAVIAGIWIYRGVQNLMA
jgi:hypothetical protein